jgi:predicted DNA-binding ribbon-helix-helix protein
MIGISCICRSNRIELIAVEMPRQFHWRMVSESLSCRNRDSNLSSALRPCCSCGCAAGVSERVES